MSPSISLADIGAVGNELSAPLIAHFELEVRLISIDDSIKLPVAVVIVDLVNSSNAVQPLQSQHLLGFGPLSMRTARQMETLYANTKRI